MPFSSCARPSMQLGLLKSIATAHGFPTTTFHLNLDFSKRIGSDSYEELSQTHLPYCDWLFSLDAFGNKAPDLDERLLSPDSGIEISRWLGHMSMSAERFREIRRKIVPDYLDQLMEEIPWGDFKVVGFTSTFQQNVSSFALARRIKERYPDVLTLFGGANFDDVMGREAVRSIACIDYAISGEADLALPSFLEALCEGRDPLSVPGVLGRGADGELRAAPPIPPFEDLGSLPVPDYREYFQRAEKLGLIGLLARSPIEVPIESARGCWWGEKHHCTFCGLNATTMKYRVKPPHRMLKELEELDEQTREFRFGKLAFFAVDNILDMGYLEHFFKQLAERGCDYEFFYEIKANLERHQIETLYRGGVRRVQPGIESLNTDVLKLMRKGIRGIANVNTLRWLQFYGIEAGWNLLWGFPGETLESYISQEEILRKLVFLRPPVGATRISTQRFSPIFNDRDSFPVRFAKPQKSYSFTYPENVDLDQIAYFFRYDLEGTLPDEAFEPTEQTVRLWQGAWDTGPRPTLTYRTAGAAGAASSARPASGSSTVTIEDQRNPDEPRVHVLESSKASLFMACSDRPRSISKLESVLSTGLSAREIEESLEELCSLDLMLREDALFLSLPLPADPGQG